MSLSDYFADFIAPEGPRRAAAPTLSNAKVIEYVPGALGLFPHLTSEASPLILSAGIHGDETAPIELFGELLAALDAGQLLVGAPVLLIMGNRRALVTGKRFVDTNLNRLFQRGEPTLEDKNFEAGRARELMRAVDAFLERQKLSGLHLDLHSAIRDSLYPRFAIEPHSATPAGNDQWQMLAGAGIQAALTQHTHSWTFSHYSRHYHGAQGFTLELGRVAPFGANDLAPLAPLLDLLRTLVAGTSPPATTACPVRFEVIEEVLRESDDFELSFGEEIANFTELLPGTPLLRDGVNGERLVEGAPVHVVFPNARVARGARALLLARPVAST